MAERFAADVAAPLTTGVPVVSGRVVDGGTACSTVPEGPAAACPTVPESPAAASAHVPRMTFIVPVYNTEQTLPACLDSALAQTVRDIEVVCVDDGSPDGAAAVLASYAERDARVRIIHQANAGLSAARNTGIAAARGELIAFLDSDDAVEPNLCERVLAAFSSAEGVDAVAFGAVCEPEEAASARIKRLLSPEDRIFHGFDPALLFSANAQPYAWRTVLTRAFVERGGIRFDESLRFAEDVPFHFTVYPLARTTVLIADKLYRYRMTEGSLTHVFNARSSRERKLEQHLEVLASIFSAWEDHSLGALCPTEMVTWCLDFTLFDLLGVSDRCAQRSARRLAELLERAYGPRWADLPQQGAVRHAAHAVKRADASGVHLGKAGLMRFFVATRGLAQCVERALRRG